VDCSFLLLIVVFDTRVETKRFNSTTESFILVITINMSSLRLALKQSLVEAGGGPTKKEKSERKRADLLLQKQQQKQHQQQQQQLLQTTDLRTTTNVNKRKPGDPPRKRGRPRKHPLPEQQQLTGITPSQHPNNSSSDSSSDENEFAGYSSEESQNEGNPRRPSPTLQTRGLFESDNETDCESENENGNAIITNHDKQLIPKEHSAANKIQSQWKRKKHKTKPILMHDAQSSKTVSCSIRATSPKQDCEEAPKKKSSKEALTVTPPSIHIIDFMESLSQKKKRRHICAGLRVKVRFATKVKKRDQKVVKKLKWYGGLVTAVSTGGSKIRIKYDDGTSEVSKFPDKDVIVDEENNGRHRVPADVFFPPNNEESQEPSEEEDEPEPIEEEQETRVKKSTKQRDQQFTSPKTDTDDSNESIGRSRMPTNMSPVPTSTISAPSEEAEQVPLSSKESNGAVEIISSSGIDQEIIDCENKDIAKLPTATIESDHPQQLPSDNADQEKDCLHDTTLVDMGETSMELSSDGRINGSRTLATTDDSSDDDDDASMEIIEESTLSQEDAKVKNIVAAQTESRPSSLNQLFEKNDGGEADNEDESDCNSGTKRPREDDDSEIIAHKSARLDESDETASNEDQDDDEKEAEFDGDEPVTQSIYPSDQVEVVSESQGAKCEDDAGQVDEIIYKTRSVDLIGFKGVDGDCDAVAVATKPHKRKQDKRECDSAMTDTSSPLILDKSLMSSDSPTPVLSEQPLCTDSLPTPDSVVPFSMKSGNEEDADDESLVKDQQSFEISKRSDFEKEKRKFKKIKDLPSISPDDQFIRTPTADRIDDLDSMNAPRSGRRAAQAANERIASRQELVIQDEYSKPKKKRTDIKGPGGREPKQKEHEGEESNESDDDHHWVQCDACSKWRVLPASVDVDALPKNWYCKFNVYDALRNSCEAAEQTAEEVAKAKRKAKRKLARLALLESPSNLQSITEESEAIDASQGEIAPKDERRKKKVGRPPKERKELVLKKDGKNREKDDRSKRASPVLMQSDASRHPSPVEELGSDSHHMLDSRKKLNLVGKRPREEPEEEVKESDSLTSQIKGKRPRGRPAKEQSGNKEGKPTNEKSSDPDNQEWVQCEKCEKWRRLPPHISAGSLPDRWYCNMNSWDPYAATCEAQEDKADPGHLPVTGFAAGNKLSYRNLIFGTGKKHNRPISERMRAAESLFSSHPFDHSHEHHPVVMYANSSVFMARGQSSKSQEEKDAERVSFFNVMNRTNLWTELRGIAQQLSTRNANGSYDGPYAAEYTFKSLPEELKSELKELIFHVLGSGELADYEVLVKTQNSPFENVQSSWSELRELCTSQSVLAALIDLVKDGRVEAIEKASGDDSVQGAMQKFRRLVVKQQPTGTSAIPDSQRRKFSKCMKISKPWKVARVE